ncbi:MAG: hypothetical protein NY202_01300 [Mollicutes bacterium UO1]
MPEKEQEIKDNLLRQVIAGIIAKVEKDLEVVEKIIPFRKLVNGN